MTAKIEIFNNQDALTCGVRISNTDGAEMNLITAHYKDMQSATQAADIVMHVAMAAELAVSFMRNHEMTLNSPGRANVDVYIGITKAFQS